ncbi:hypothetical protein WA1_39130 [Scytonema hofmannii PCC 7110]|uniref:Uncharacterized protein n=1 Tax=Scytonema hofmannii PCC 7110 TaxID=128403 RepID=A0A139X0X5_9CYAN|nr:hypothetical protein [Scytonema hofmannii]KYC38344.1 hypothetical protein WA1_39130 [Scytonema hofmannii PCC 7110]
MKKVLAILTSAVALGSAIFAAPANAVNQDVNVEITIQPTMYLRTFQNVKLQVTQGDLGAQDKDFNSTPDTDGNTLIDQTKPNITAGTNLSAVVKNVKELFAVWSNSSTGVNVTVTPVTKVLTNTVDGTAATLTSSTAVINTTGNPTLTKALVGGANLTFDLSQANQSGTYKGGVIRVEALAKP